MTKVLLAVALFGGSIAITSVSLADILRPPMITTETIVGKKAGELYESMNVPLIRGDSLRTMISTYKVVRSADELKQTICEKSVYSLPKRKTTYRCTRQTSADGNPVPEFHPIVRMG